MVGVCVCVCSSVVVEQLGLERHCAVAAHEGGLCVHFAATDRIYKWRGNIWLVSSWIEPTDVKWSNFLIASRKNTTQSVTWRKVKWNLNNIHQIYLELVTINLYVKLNPACDTIVSGLFQILCVYPTTVYLDPNLQCD